MFPNAASTAPFDSRPRPRAREITRPDELANVRRAIWLYFWLLIFEGALRKWFLPGFSNPLLLIRDPVVILIYILAGMAGVFPRSSFIPFLAGLSVVTMISSELAGQGNLLVTLYGFRTSFLHLPLIFLVPEVFDRKDVEKMAKCILIISVPMAFLVLAQFRAAPEAWINNGAGAGVGAQLEVGFGKIRPPGTFSFTAGFVSFLSLSVATGICALMKKGLVSRKITLAALPALALMVAISGSRSALGMVVLILIAVIYIVARRPQLASGAIRSLIAVGIVYAALSTWGEFRYGLTIHQSRVETGGGIKAGIVLRTFDGLLEPIGAIADSPFFGHGLGMGTNGATGFLYGAPSFSLGEGDWGRTIGEIGPVFGLLYIGIRIGIVCLMIERSLVSLNRENPLPILICASVLTEVLNGQFGVPSLLGLAVFKAGLCLAATNIETLPLAASVDLPQPSFEPLIPGFRGRSAYADQLHGDVADPIIDRFGP